MTKRSLLVELVRIEIMRARIPFFRSLLPGAAFLGAALAGYTRYFPIGVGVLAVMGVLAIPQLVGRDRTSGVFDYFSTLPVSGLVLFGARVAATALFTVATSGLLYALLVILAPTVIGPFIVIRQVRVLLLCTGLLIAVGAIVVALLSRFSPTVIVVVPMVTLVVGEKLNDSVLQNSAVSLWLSTGVAHAMHQPAVSSLIVLPLFGVALVGATLLAKRSMQPSGEPLSAGTYADWRAAWEAGG